MLRENKVKEPIRLLSRRSSKEEILKGNFGLSAQEIADILDSNRAI